MEKDIDEILAHYLNKQSLTEEEKQFLQEWIQTSSTREEFWATIKRLESQRKILDNHQKSTVVFEKIRRKVRYARKKHRFIAWSSCAACVAFLTGIFFILKDNSPAPKENELRRLELSHIHPAYPSAELVLPDGQKRLLDAREITVIMADSTGKIRTDENTLIIETNNIEQREPEYYTLNVPFGVEYNVELPDGTKVYLNAGSSFRYPDQFTGNMREVFLVGEAYFEVSSDSLHPFIVQTADISVRVLGTSFNVHAYPEEKWVKTTLVEGRVETRCGDKNFVMAPHTQVAYNKKTQAVNYYPVDPLPFISWKDGYYDFEDMPLEELMQIFMRWYNVKVEFVDPEVKEIKFSGRLKRHEDVYPLFKMMEYTRDVRFFKENGKIVIRKK